MPSQIYEQVEILDPNNPGPVPPGHIRIVMISDTHCYHHGEFNVPPGDLLLHSGMMN